ncbi:MAG: hypothetical protein AAGG02_14605 [Cyanobacteria bacterium P01_H01_bin.15]
MTNPEPSPIELNPAKSAIAKELETLQTPSDPALLRARSYSKIIAPYFLTVVGLILFGENGFFGLILMVLGTILLTFQVLGKNPDPGTWLDSLGLPFNQSNDLDL